jgi:hypothetical protein
MQQCLRTSVKLSGVLDTVPGMRIGYGRVSTRAQNPNAQHDALAAAGGDEISSTRCPASWPAGPSWTGAAGRPPPR